LPFNDGAFDVVVSNFRFSTRSERHRTKERSSRSRLRVLRTGGAFAFQDLFPVDRLYGETNELLSTVRSWGIRNVEYVNTSNA